MKCVVVTFEAENYLIILFSIHTFHCRSSNYVLIRKKYQNVKNGTLSLVRWVPWQQSDTLLIPKSIQSLTIDRWQLHLRTIYETEKSYQTRQLKFKVPSKCAVMALFSLNKDPNRPKPILLQQQCHDSSTAQGVNYPRDFCNVLLWHY